MSKKAAIVAHAKPQFDAELLTSSASSAKGAIDRVSHLAVDLVEAWIAAKNVEAVFAIAEDEQAPAPARKAARRGLQVLKSRGVSLPERTHVARIGETERVVESWILAPDPGGAMLVIVAAHTPSRRHDVARVVIQPGAGVTEVGRSEMSGSQMREWFTDIVKRTAHAPASVPTDWARARIAEVQALHEKSGLVPPLGLESLADLIGPVPSVAPPHPIDAAQLELPEPSTVVPGSMALHNEPEFRGWLPPGQAIQALFGEVGQKLAQKGTPNQQPSKEVFDEVLAESLDLLTDRFFIPDVRAQVASAMKDAAISVLEREGRERAAEVMAVARAVVSAGLVTQPPHEVPFLRAFFQKAVAVVAAQSGGQLSIPVPVLEGAEAREDAGALVTPADIAAEKAAPGEKVSPGGIILP